MGARGRCGHCRHRIAPGRREHRQHDGPDHPGHRQCYPPGRGSRAPHRGRHRRVARSLWLCPLRLGADPGHLRRSRSDAGAASADGLWAVIALPRRRHRLAAPRGRRRARLHRGNDQQDAARRSSRQARLSGQCCGCRRGGGAGFRADRPFGRIRRVPRPFDRQPGARDRRRDRDRLADRRRKVARAGAACAAGRAARPSKIVSAPAEQ